VSRLDDALELVAIDSVSRGEAAIAHHVAVVLARNPDLDVERIGDNVVARTTGHHATRLLVAGHLDTVPGDASSATIVGDELPRRRRVRHERFVGGDARAGVRTDATLG